MLVLFYRTIKFKKSQLMLFQKKFVGITLLIGLLLPIATFACIWDHDTLQSEKFRFPDTLELITGKFLRHSKEFYHWRIQDRITRLKSDPTNTSLLDDLAVSYEKTDNHEKAIEIAIETEKINPGRYETAANLGTFYLHSGKFKEGLEQIEKAIKINPDAHFGREIYQKLLVEYLTKTQPNLPFNFPISTIIKTRNSPFHLATNTFVDFLKEKSPEKKLTPQEVEKAVKGILGMMKFGNYNSPVLLEALGFLLLYGDEKEDAKQLAARAFLKASYEVVSGDSKSDYRFLASRALFTQTSPEARNKSVTLDQIENEFKEELKDAEAWYNDLYQKEIAWIKSGKNPEKEFDKLYKQKPSTNHFSINKTEIIVLILAICVALYIFYSQRTSSIEKATKRKAKHKKQ